MNTKGLETLVYLENLDLSENLIELYVLALDLQYMVWLGSPLIRLVVNASL